MSGRAPATDELQPKSFKFSDKNLKEAKKEIVKYPKGKQASAVKALLFLAQEQNAGWVSRAAMDQVATMLDMSFIKVYEIATFYTMFNLAPVGKYLIQLCGTTPCWLRGSDDLKEVAKKKLGIAVGETTKDKKFTLVEVECLGACANAPMVQINNDYYEDLDKDNFTKLLDDLAKNKKVKVGSQRGRTSSEPKITDKKN
jgi:NADH-quinone oxidoreductase E subunit